jgi:hypothetical protein
VYRMLAVYLYCPLFCLSSSCVPYVASFSRLFLFFFILNKMAVILWHVCCRYPLASLGCLTFCYFIRF